MKAKIEAKWVVKIPEGADVLVKEGSKVEKGDILIRTKSRELQSIDMSMILSKFSQERLNEISVQLQDRVVEEGEIIWESGGLFSKKVYSPCSGVFLGIDEFYNFQFDIKREDNKDILSPLKAKVVDKDKYRLVLAFGAREFQGQPIVDGKTWGECGFEELNKLSDLSYKLEGRIILTSNLDQSFLTKAEVIGVAAIVTNTKVDESESVDTRLPILNVEDKDWEKMKSEFKGEEKQVLVNSKKGRLLVVVE